MIRALVAIAAAGVLLAGCGRDTEHATAPDPDAPRTITVSSPAFDEGETIPARYTCQGKGISPPLDWSGVSGDVGSLALVVDDPDAPDGGYVHWVVLGLPTGHGALDEGTLPDGVREVDGSGGHGWKPPCPPSRTHHYRFTVYAFSGSSAFAWRKDTPLDEVLELLADQAVAWGRLTGKVTASGGDSGGGY